MPFAFPSAFIESLFCRIASVVYPVPAIAKNDVEVPLNSTRAAKAAVPLSAFVIVHLVVPFCERFKVEFATNASEVPDATPMLGVVKDGDVANTSGPEPVSSEMTPASCADVVAANCDSGLPVTPHVAQVIFPVAVVIARGDDAVTAGVPVLLPHVTVGAPAAAGT